MRIWLRAAALSLILVLPAAAADLWSEGIHYYVINPARPVSTQPGKVEVTEVFSYACPACWQFLKRAEQLQAELPANAFMDFLPAAFRADEDWPVFQRGYFAAQALGIDKTTHEAMFDAVWKTGELATLDLDTGRPKSQMPTIEDLTGFYARRAGVSAATFANTAKSFAIDSKIRQAQDTMRAWLVDSTPTIVVAGKYRLTEKTAGGPEALIELVKYLIVKEGGVVKPPVAKPTVAKPVPAAKAHKASQ